jgi:Proteasome stabiliser
MAVEADLFPSYLFGTKIISISCYNHNLLLLCYREKADMAVRLFMALRLENQSLRLAIQEAASSLATAYKVSKLWQLRSFLIAFSLSHIILQKNIPT